MLPPREWYTYTDDACTAPTSLPERLRMNPEAVLALLVLALLADTGVSVLARALQLRHQPDTPPPELAERLDAGTYARGRAYARDLARVGYLADGVRLAAWLGLLLSGALGAWYAATASWTDDGWLTPLLFLALVGLAFDLLGLPFDVYRTFIVEARYGFNTTSPATFVRDRLTGYALAIALGGALLALLFWSIERWGSAFWIPYAALAAVVLVLLNTFMTSVLLPLFNKLTPLPDGELKAAISDYVRRTGFEIADTYVMDGSKRSRKANAFFAGLGRQKKVVLFDTLIEHHPTSEVVAVLAHEVGHARLRHLPRLLLGSIASVTLLLFVLSLAVDSATLSQALGASERVVALNLVAFMLLFTPVSSAIGVLTNALSRRFEYQADAFAARTHGPAAMRSALMRLTTDAHAAPLSHPLYEWLHMSHPASVDRLRALDRLCALDRGA